MDYIVMDIEFNGRKFASELPMEVIEIGAVRLDDQLRLKDEFSSFIKPVYFSKLNTFIKTKTGIPQESIDQAEGFGKVSADFMNWLQLSEECLFVTWGGEDFKRIIYDTRMHKINDEYWMSARYYDLLKGYIRSKNVTNDVGLEAALVDLGIDAEGAAHRALDDARMTAEVFRKIYTLLDLGQAKHFKDVYSNAKERRIIKNAVRALVMQKAELSWERLLEQFLKDKIKLEDPRKTAELQQYFNEEAARAVQKKQQRRASHPEPANPN